MGDNRHLKQQVRLAISQRFQPIQEQTLTPFTIEETASGCVYQVNPNIHILTYDSELDGQKRTTTLKLANDVLTVVRIGTQHCRQTFAQDEWYASQFFYEGRSLLMRHFVTRLEAYLPPHANGFIHLEYDLWSGNTRTSHVTQRWVLQ
jgi:uncharacterized beta-barrel protein YwiB (DUF1934 family)